MLPPPRRRNEPPHLRAVPVGVSLLAGVSLPLLATSQGGTMNAPQLLRYLRTWQATHFMVHGALTEAEQAIVNEITEFLLNCAQAERVP